MEQRKTNKKKLVVALALLALLVVASVITTVVLVLAAGTQNVSSQINVSYKLEDVSARVGAKYFVKGDTEKTVIGAVRSVNPEDTETIMELNKNDEIKLTSTKNYVVFEYSFENKATNTYTIKQKTGEAEPATQTNIKTIKYLVSNAELTITKTVEVEGVQTTVYDADVVANATWVEFDNTNGVTCPAGTAVSGSVPEANYGKVYIYALVEVENLNLAASLAGTFNFVLTADVA